MTADPGIIRVDVMMCDWAEAVQAKLYIMGAGWTREVVASVPFTAVESL